MCAFRDEFVSASGALQSAIGIATPAIVGTDGITVISGSSTTTVSGFYTEFVAASGTLAAEIDSDISTHAAISDAHHTRYEKEENDAIIGGDNVTVVSGANTITVSSAQDVSDAMVGVDGITVISGTPTESETTVSGFRAEFVAASGFLNDHGNLSGLSDDDHTQYLLEDGSRPISADWDNTGQRIRNTGTSEVTDIEPSTPATGLLWYDTTASGITSSGVVMAIKTITVNTTVELSDTVIRCNASSGAILVTLPTTVGNSGQTYYIKKVDSSGNIVTISGNSISESVELATTAIITIQGESLTLVGDSLNWDIL